MMTLQEGLEWGRTQLKKAEIEDGAREARLLLGLILDLRLEYMIGHPEHKMDAQAFETYEKAVKRRVLHEPVSKILGKREFWSLSFDVTRDTLDPRADSETIVEAVLDCIADRDAPLQILDLGTGTGCLLLALLHELPNSYGIGIDKSIKAASVAKINASKLGLGARAGFAACDWAQAIWGAFDFVISNPPYLSEADMKILAPNVSLYDPHSALKGGQDGLECYRIIASQLSRLLKDTGRGAFEIGAAQEDQVVQIMQASGFKVSEKRADLSGRARCIVVARQ